MLLAGVKEAVEAINNEIDAAQKMGKERREEVKKNLLFLERTCIELANQLANLKSTSTTIPVKPATSARSFAAVTSGKPPVQPKHVFRVYQKKDANTPDSPSQSSQSTKQMVLKVNVQGLRTGVHRIKPIGKGGVVVECRNKEEIKVLTQAIESSGANLEVKETKKVNPTFTALLQGKDHDREEVCKDLLDKNDFLPAESISVVHKWNTQNGNTIIVIEATPTAYQRIVSNDHRLFYGWSSVKLRERDPVSQCFKCNRFGHKAKECRFAVNGQPASRCARCGNSHEDMDKCEAPLSCSNCVEHNKFAKEESKFNTNHSARDKSCPCRAKAIHRARQFNIDYGY